MEEALSTNVIVRLAIFFFLPESRPFQFIILLTAGAKGTARLGMSQVNIVWPIIHSTLQRLLMSEGKAFAGRHYLAFTWRCNVLQSACTIPQPDQQSATSDSSSIAFLTQIKRKLMDKCFAQTCPSVPLSVRHSTPCRLVHLQEPVFKIWKGAQAKEITRCLKTQ